MYISIHICIYIKKYSSNFLPASHLPLFPQAGWSERVGLRGCIKPRSVEREEARDGLLMCRAERGRRVAGEGKKSYRGTRGIREGKGGGRLVGEKRF